MAEKKPSRDSSSWLKGAKNCSNRAIPCGNPLDADEIMRAAGIEKASDDFISKIQAEQAVKHAFNIASDCKTPEEDCPVVNQFGGDKITALKRLKSTYKD